MQKGEINHRIFEKINFAKFCLILFATFLFPLQLKAQFQTALDSLYKLKTPIERTRGFLGSAEELKLSREDYNKYMNAAEKLAIEKNDQLMLKHFKHIRRAWKSYGKNTPTDRIKANQNLAELYQEQDDILFAGYCYNYSAHDYFNMQDYELASENYFLAYDIFKKVGFENVPIISKFLHDFALFHYYFKNYKEVINLMEISAKYPPYNNNHHIQLYNNLAISYSNLGEKKIALFYFEKTRAIAKNYNDKTWEGITSGNLGDIFYKEKKYLEALKQYKTQYNIIKKSPFDPIRISSYNNLAKVYLALDSLDKTKKFLTFTETDLNNLRKNKSYGDDQQLESFKRNYFDLKSQYLIRSNNFQEAIKYKDSLANAQYSLDSKYNLSVIKMSSDKLLIQKKELELSRKEEKEAKLQFFYTFVILIILILGGIGYFHLYKSRQKKKQQNEKLIAQNKISLLEKQQTEKELIVAKKEIDHFINKVNEHNNTIGQLEVELIQIKNLELSQEKQINKTLRNLKSMKILTDQDWSDFQNNFTAVFPEFTNNLKSNLSITASEMRYLMLTKLELSNKEMAAILGVSESAVRLTWSRLRKKLNLDTSESPISLVEKISSIKLTKEV